MARRHSPEREAEAARMITELFPVTESEGEEALPSTPTATPPLPVQARQQANVQARQPANPFELPPLPQRPATKRLKDLPLQAADVALQSAQFPGQFPGRMPDIQLRPEPAGGDWHVKGHVPGQSNVRWLTVAVVLVWTVAGLIWITGPLWPVQSFLSQAASTEAATRRAPDPDRTVATTGISETPAARLPESPAASQPPNMPTASRAPEVSTASQAARLDTPAAAPARTERAPAVVSTPPPRPAAVQPPSRLPVAPTPSPVRAATEPSVTTPSSRPTETPTASTVREAVNLPVDRTQAEAPAASPSAPPPAINPPAMPAPESVVAGAAPPAVSPSPPAPAVVNPPVSAPASAAETPASSPAAAAIPSSTRAADIQAVERVLGRYRAAYERLDAAAARSVWPKVNSSALERAFAQLEQQGMSFDRCEIGIYGALAQASCSGTSRYVPRTGSKTPRVDRRQWTFRLRKGTEDWTIDSVEVR
jgi:hypothetical protein